MSGTKCKWVMDRLSDPTVEYLLVHEKKAIDEHLGHCSDCRDFKRAAAALSNTSSHLVPPPVSPFMDRRIIQAALDGEMPFREANRGRRKQFRYALAGVSLLVLLSALMLQFSPPERTMRTQLGQFSVSFDGLLKPNDMVRTAPEIAATVTFDEKGDPLSLPGGDRIWGTPGSAVAIETFSPSLVGLRLMVGKIVADVDGSRPERRFVVHTDTSLVEVRGTLFSVEATSAGASSVRVLQGLVQVTDLSSDSRDEYLLHASQQYSSGGEFVAVASQEALDADLLLIDASPMDDSVKMAAHAHLAGPRAPMEESAVLLAKNALERAHLEEAKRQIDRASARKSEVRDVPHLLARLARAYRQQNKYKKAREIYERLISEYSGSGASRNALVALAQLELNVFGDQRSALSHFSGYLKIEPDGYLAEDAWVGMARANGAMGKHGAVVSLVEKYLASGHARVFRPEMARRRADALAGRGNCGPAVEEYKKIIKLWPSSREAAMASRGLDRCQTH